jgi:hypothetical protein
MNDWIEMAKTEVGGIVDVPANKSGKWEIRKWTQTEEMALNSMFRYRERLIPKGDYTALLENGKGFMTDTPAEIGDHGELLAYADGNILIMGLGLGLIMEMIHSRYENGYIDGLNQVVFIEKNQDVIDLVAPHYEKKYPDFFKVVKADALALTPDKLFAETGVEKWDAIWIDIWPTICEDNAEEYLALLDRWDAHGKWVHAWQEDYVLEEDGELYW